MYIIGIGGSVDQLVDWMCDKEHFRDLLLSLSREEYDLLRKSARFTCVRTYVKAQGDLEFYVLSEEEIEVGVEVVSLSKKPIFVDLACLSDQMFEELA